MSSSDLSSDTLPSFTELSTELSSLYTAEQVSDVDHYAIEQLGIPAIVLMKRAGRYSFEQLLAQWPVVEHIHIFCGSGNNAGDGYVMAALAQQRQLEVTVWSLVDPGTLKGAAQRAWEYAQQEQVVCQPYDPSLWQEAIASIENTVVVDALLGTGAKGEPRDAYASAINAINQSGCPVMAVDIPSGVDANTGDVPTVAVRAAMTVSFVGQKRGLFTGQGRAHSGDRYFTDLDIPLDVYESHEPSAQVIHYQDWLALLPQRDINTHKGDCGHVLVVGGDTGEGYGYGGAPIMAAQMALRTGAGLVSVATRPEYVAPTLARQPEMMVAGIENGLGLLPMLERASGIVIGPGLGRSPWSEQLLYQVLSLDEASAKPLVLDADALQLLALDTFAQLSPLGREQRQWVCTPHPGEAANLLGVSIADVEADRFSACAQLQQRLGGVVILKGAGTVVTISNGEQWLCDMGNPGMASGGMGDVLSGLIGSLLVQGMSIDAAALLAVSTHALAADIVVDAQGMRGLLATDLIPVVRRLIDGKADGAAYV